MNTPLILGSTSQRRKQLLEQLGLDFTQIDPQYNEEQFIWPSDVAQGVELLACEKAKVLMARFPSHIILTADTIVVFNQKILGKPKNQDQARDYLMQLRGCEHAVYTGVCVSYQNKQWRQSQKSLVRLYPLSDSQIEMYIQTPIPYDKAGGYGIQNAQGGLLVESIQGCYYNVMGLPLHLTAQLLLNAKVDVWRATFSL